MKQRLGAKKHALCERIAGKTYTQCWTSGNYGHGIAECWFSEKDADYVYYELKCVVPKYRDGQNVT